MHFHQNVNDYTHCYVCENAAITLLFALKRPYFVLFCTISHALELAYMHAKKCENVTSCARICVRRHVTMCTFSHPCGEAVSSCGPPLLPHLQRNRAGVVLPAHDAIVPEIHLGPAVLELIVCESRRRSLNHKNLVLG